MTFDILTPQRIRMGGGTASLLAETLRGAGLENPLCVIDPAIVRLGVADPALMSLRADAIPFAVFDDIVEDPTERCAHAAAKQYRDGGHDSLVAIGGGSAIDTAKAAAVLLSHEEDLSALKVPRILDAAAPPVVAMPTTAGTGSEVTRACVITAENSGEKMLLLGTACLPVAVIADYELTLSCPATVTAHTGLDALSHALEAMVNRNANAYSDALARSALGLIGTNLERAFREPDNRAAREAMTMGALQAGMAVSNTSTALIHGMSRPLGALFHVPHGLSIAMLMPTVSVFSAEAAPGRYAACARALGWADEGGGDAPAVTALVTGLRRLNRALSIPSIAGYGVDPEHYMDSLDEMIAQAVASGTPANNLRHATRDDMRKIYRDILANESAE